ncbi:HI1506-related protein [Ancylobacter pratisalsi]|uniref:Mu-like prophage FluMu N-terminal domain-containing protein n=1 Tax=Ancylobacter pratisalsi TaxID=1745854 RepID=A0A6P1YNW9_9HYPH|nr:HI1506-related protein [Ancylobacter pratisalsi]QIB34752.1 hypothetical protein G3A50_14330 [Ancylobacter pratisalsi]
MNRIVVTSARPGFRRAGIEHPARKIYAPGELTDTQLDALRAEPELTVAEITASEESRPVDGTLPSTGRGAVDRLAVLMLAMGASGPLAALISAHLGELAERALVRHVAPAAFAGLASDRCKDLIAEHGYRLGVNGILEPRQTADAEGQQAEPEAETVETLDGEAAPASGDEAESLAVPTSETGEVSEAGAAPASGADLVSHGEQATDVVSQETASVEDKPAPAPAKSRRRRS